MDAYPLNPDSHPRASDAHQPSTNAYQRNTGVYPVSARAKESVINGSWPLKNGYCGAMVGNRAKRYVRPSYSIPLLASP